MKRLVSAATAWSTLILLTGCGSSHAPPTAAGAERAVRGYMRRHGLGRPLALSCTAGDPDATTTKCTVDSRRMCRIWAVRREAGTVVVRRGHGVCVHYEAEGPGGDVLAW